MNIFSTQQDVVVSVEKDTIGFQSLLTDIYETKVKNAYVNTYAGGSYYVNLELEFTKADGSKQTQTFRELFWSAKTQGDFYVHAKSGKKMQLQGKITLNQLSVILTGKTMEELFAEGGIENKFQEVMVDGKKTPQEKQTFTAWIQADSFYTAIQRVVKNKQVKVGDKYVNTNEKSTENELSKFFNLSYQTNIEIAENKPATFHKDWLETYQGKDRNLFKETTTQPTVGLPQASNPVAAAEKLAL